MVRATFLKLAGVFSAMIIIAPAAAQTAAPTPPVPAGHPGEWITDDDYPPHALASNSSGVVRFQLTISDKGVPKACAITASSNSAELDQKTCDLLMQRGQFTPAHGADGKPVEGIYRNFVNWQIPSLPVPKSGASTIAFDILLDGSRANCVATATGAILEGIKSHDPQTLCSENQSYDRPVDASGKPVRKHVVYETRIVVTEDD